MTLIERLARAAWAKGAECEERGVAWEALDPDGQAIMCEMVRAVLSGIEEPTEEMLAAARALNHPTDAEIFAAMIRAAKGE